MPAARLVAAGLLSPAAFAEIVEGALRAGRIEELRRIDLTPALAFAPH